MNKYPGIYKALDGTIYYYLNKSNFFSPERNRWEEDCDNDDHKTDVNITADYLANTYGKVENKEHAEFIVRLAESAGFNISDKYSKDIQFFCFFKGSLLFYVSKANAMRCNEKLITIPPPPKEQKKEWLQVGDSALTASKQKVTVLAVHEGEVWVKHDDTLIETGYASVRVSTLSKPPTPEDELDRKLYDFFQCNSKEDLAKAIINGEIEGLEYKS